MPRPRIFTVEESARYLLKRTPPLHFKGKTREEYVAWHRAFRRAILKELGPPPDPVPLRPEVVERRTVDGVKIEKVVFDADEFSSVPAWVGRPADLKRGEKLPGVLCAHGHGVGKDGTFGLNEDGYQKAIGIALARQGFITIAPDWRTFGERCDKDDWVRRPSRDGCNVAYLAMGYFGHHLLGLQINDARRTLDYLSSLPEVDERRLGMIGCSFGGTMTTYTSALDTRIKAAVIVCYLSTIWDALTDRKGNTCGSQYMPGLRKYGDIADVAGLIAPRRLMAQIGSDDQCFIQEDALKAYQHLAGIYRAAGMKDRLELDHFQGGHEIDYEAGAEFLSRHLGAKPRG